MAVSHLVENGAEPSRTLAMTLRRSVADVRYPSDAPTAKAPLPLVTSPQKTGQMPNGRSKP